MTARLAVLLAFVGALPAAAQAPDTLPDAPQDGVVAQVGGLTPIGLTGQAAFDQFGNAVASAGDVNGDGFDDVIVGAQANGTGGTNAGRAYIFFGGPTMDNAPDVILTGAAPGDRFGLSVAGAGDVNGDGFADVVVGAPYNSSAGTYAGRAYVFFGGPMMDVAPDVTLTGAAAGQFFGQAVTGAGDVNGDGFADVLVGAPQANATGRAYVYFGGAAMNTGADVTLKGSVSGDTFGTAVSGAGDVNGDGFGDVLVGAPANDAGGPNAGRATVHFGGAAMDAGADVTLTGAAGSDEFGTSVAGAGDVNGDGFTDVVVGAPFNSAGGSAAGRAYVYRGGAAMDATADVTLTGVAATDVFGYAVSGVGDVDGDGFADIVVGAPFNDSGGAEAGRAYVYRGGAAMDAFADVTLTGRVVSESFGIAVGGGGDVNGDGRPELVVGAYGYDSYRGRAQVLGVRLTGEDLPDEFFTGAAANDRFGSSVAGAGDVNGDGYDDVVVGADGNDAGGNGAGRAYVYFGGPGADTVADVTLTGAAADNFFGESVAGVGDVNSDGYDDVVVGAPYNDANGTDAGRAYVYFGGAAMNAVADVTLAGAAADDLFGESVAGAGDVNGDGYDDVVVGSSYNDANGTDAGRAYVYFGGTTMNPVADVVMNGQAAGYKLGYSVASAGDVNGDGYDDIVVGANTNSTAGANDGRAYVFFGGAVMDATADVTLTGAAAFDSFGESVAGAGDVNGDGYDDVVVGAPYNDANGTDAGRAYVYFGEVAMDATADVTLTGAAASNFFGHSVAGAGDVNGDGVADVVIGARYNSLGGPGAGRAYVFFGGAAMDATADVTLTGAAGGDEFGKSVTGAGDVNGDGVADLLVGAYGNDAGGTNAGRAYLFRSTSPPVHPRLAAVRDVPDDQGGFVRAEWTASAYDAQGINRVTEYVVERRGPGELFWEPVATIPATHRPGYSAIVPTYGVPAEGTSTPVVIQVTARTAHPDEYWRSTVVTGASIDNIAPPAPAALAATLDGDHVRLAWDGAEAPDVAAYAVYRSPTPGFAPTDSLLAATVDGLAWTDETASTGEPWYYRVAARDANGNEGEPSAEAGTTTVGTEDGGLPNEFALSGLAPNPVTGASAVVRYALPEPSAVTVVVYDVLGREVARLVDDVRPAGYHTAAWRVGALAAGAYVVRLRAGPFEVVRSLTVVR